MDGENDEQELVRLFPQFVYISENEYFKKSPPGEGGGHTFSIQISFLFSPFFSS